MLRELHMWMQLCVCVCVFPGCAAVRKRAGFPSPPVLSLRSLIGPRTLCFHSVFAVFPLHLLALSCRQEGPGPPIVPVPGKKPLQAKSEQNGKHRWPPTRRRVHGKHGPTFSLLLCSLSHLLFLLLLSVLVRYRSLLPRASSQA